MVRPNYLLRVFMVLMAALLALLAFDVSDADARKRRPALNKVTCPTSGSFTCNGTPKNDLMLGQSLTGTNVEVIRGGEGNDVYKGNAGADELFDSSTTSNDTYTGYSPATGPNSELDRIRDLGGYDTLDLSSYSAAQVSTVRGDFNSGTDGANDLEITMHTISGETVGTILVTDHFGSSADSVIIDSQSMMERIKLADRTISFR
jgi:Ca2+-binding RTX toxin-like protein